MQRWGSMKEPIAPVSVMFATLSRIAAGDSEKKPYSALTISGGTSGISVFKGAHKLDVPVTLSTAGAVNVEAGASLTMSKAFSGTVAYTTEFTVDTLSDNTRVELDLGRVEVIASVRLNGEIMRVSIMVNVKLNAAHPTRPFAQDRGRH